MGFCRFSFFKGTIRCSESVETLKKEGPQAILVHSFAICVGLPHFFIEVLKMFVGFDRLL